MLTGLLLTTLLAAEVPTPPAPVHAETRRRATLSTFFGKSGEAFTKLPRGAEVQLLMQNGASLQAKASEGTVGWLEVDDLVVTRIVPTGERTLWKWVKGWRAKDAIRKVGPQDTLTVLGYAEERKWFRVKTEAGEKGFLHIQGALPDFAVELPEYDHRATTYWREDRLRAAVVGRTVDEVEARFGAPLAMQVKGGAGFLYYHRLHFARDGDELSKIRMPVGGGKVTDLEAQYRVSSIVEELPLAHTIRGLEIGMALQRMDTLPFMDTSDVEGWRWWAQSALKWLVVFLILVLPHFPAKWATTGLGYVRPLPNLVVTLAGVGLCLSAFYVYFVFWSLHGLHEEQFFLALPLAVVASFSLKIITGRIAYHRCPDCHAMFSATDEGTDLVGKTHVTINKSKDVYRGKRETSTEIIHQYERQHWKERETELRYDDHRQCAECGYRWDVRHEETVKGHV